MNELDHASLEASKKLVDNGIVLETAFYWWVEKKKVYLKKDIYYQSGSRGCTLIPAPCFTEVWRELPEGIELAKLHTCNAVFYEGKRFASDNPTEAIIELLIWVKGAGK